jgi:small subunit ribosomal protein S17
MTNFNKMKKEILGIKAPKKTCTDKKCPFHGQLNVKKELFRGKVIKKDSHHTAVIEWDRQHYLPKYERYEMRRSRLKVHNPPCLNAQVNQKVLAARTRPLSKTKNHVIIQIIKKEKETNRSKNL